jgi:hypothetical protein
MKMAQFIYNTAVGWCRNKTPVKEQGDGVTSPLLPQLPGEWPWPKGTRVADPSGANAYFKCVNEAGDNRNKREQGCKDQFDACKRNPPTNAPV